MEDPSVDRGEEGSKVRDNYIAQPNGGRRLIKGVGERRTTKDLDILTFNTRSWCIQSI